MHTKLSVVLVIVYISCSSCFLLNRRRPGQLPFNVNLRSTNTTAVQLEVKLINIPLSFTFDTTSRVGRRDNICDDFIIFNAPGATSKARKKPKGYCDFCCKMEPTDVVFTVHKSGSHDSTILNLNDIYAKKSLNLHKEASTIVYIHGFLEDPPHGSTETVRDVYLERPEAHNVILVDWSQWCAFPWYFNAVDNVRIIGKILAVFLASYHNLNELSIDRVHLIGFSLGAHVAGFAGKYLPGGLRLKRITGLDPALPGFSGGPKTRLSKGDADFVDIIHTDGGSFGYQVPIGHVDFYPNGGTFYQPGCSYQHQARQNNIGATISCSHQRSWEYYTESVLNPINFPAIKCKWVNSKRVCDRNTIAYMGFAAQNRGEGSFYLTTNQDSPYGKSEAIL